MAEEVDVERRLRRMAELVDLSGKLFAGQHRRGQRTEAAGLRDSDGQGNTARTGHRRLHDGTHDSEPNAELITEGHTRTLRSNTTWRHV